MRHNDTQKKNTTDLCGLVFNVDRDKEKTSLRN